MSNCKNLTDKWDIQVIKTSIKTRTYYCLVFVLFLCFVLLGGVFCLFFGGGFGFVFLGF